LNNNPNSGDYSVGLWQINYFGGMLRERTIRYGAPQVLQQNPIAQAKAAANLAGTNGSGLHNWTTYTSGAYRSHLSGDSGGGGVGGAIGGAAGAVGGAVGGAGSAVGGFLSSLNPVSGVEGAIKDLAMKFVYSMAILGGGALVLLGILLVGAELGIDQATSPKGVKLARRGIGKAGIPGRAVSIAAKRAETKGQKKGYSEGVSHGQTYAEESSAAKERKAADKESIKNMKRGGNPGDTIRAGEKDKRYDINY
jgi:hypothetical protein